MNKIKFVQLSILALFFLTCSPIDNPWAPEKAKVTLISPVEGTQVTAGDSVTVKAEIYLLSILDSIRIVYGDSLDGLPLKTTIPVTQSVIKAGDTLRRSHVYPKAGEYTLSVTLYVEGVQKFDQVTIRVKPVLVDTAHHVDTIKPVIRVTALTDSAIVGQSYLNIDFTAKDNRSVKSVRVLSGSDSFVVAKIADTLYHVTITGLPLDTLRLIRFIAADTSGNIDTLLLHVTYSLSAKPVAAVIDSQPKSLIVKVGDPAHFMVVAHGTPSPTYQWYKGTTPITGAQSASYYIPSATKGDSGAVYTCKVVNATGNSTSNPATLTVTSVSAIPLVVQQPQNASVVTGAKATFSIRAEGAGLSYQWQKNKADIAQAIDSSYTTPATLSADSNTFFRCIVRNNDGKDTSDSAILIVTAQVIAPKITSGPVNDTVVEGDSAYFAVEATGTSPQFQWLKGSTPIPGATAYSYTIHVTTPADSGTTYRCVASNSKGRDSGAAALLVVKRLPPAPAIGAVTTGDSTATVTWSAVGGMTYNLYYQSGTTVTKNSVVIKNAASPKVINNLTNGTAYTFALAAVNSNGESVLGVPVTVTPKAWIISVVKTSGGTATPGADFRVLDGKDTAIAIAANAGYLIDSLLVDGQPDPAARNLATYTYRFTKVSADHAVRIKFAVKKFRLSTVMTSGVTGTISAAVAGTPISAFPAYLDSNTTVSLTAPTSDANFSFDKWTGGASGTSATVQVVMSRDTTVMANYTLRMYTLTITRVPDAGGSVTPASGTTYAVGSPVTLTAIPASGYSFGGWTGAITSTTNPASVTMSGDKNVMATFVPVYTVTYNINGGTGTALVDNNKYKQGDPVTVLSGAGLAMTGSTFAEWNTKNDGTGTTYTSSSTFSMGSANITLYAKWQCTITFDGQGATQAASPTSRPVFYLAKCVMPAEPKKTSYVFDGWYTQINGGGKRFTADSTVTGSGTVFAKWAIKDVDGNVYTEVVIGGQVWMVENLKTTKYRDGQSIPSVQDSVAWSNLTTPGYCWQNKDSVANKTPYGALYNWYVVNTGKLAPEGWHVPTDGEWTVLTTSLGGESVAAGKIKETGMVHWASPNTGATNVYGFSALPGGYRDWNGAFYDIGRYGWWWSATAGGTTNAWTRYMSYNHADVARYFYSNPLACSVRCLRD